MNRISMIVVATLTLALLVYANSRTHKAKSESDSELPACAQAVSSPDRTVAAQDRINRYFHRDVIPKLRNCWKGIQGEGEAEMKLTYARAGGNWTSETVERSGSTLPPGQDAVALRCMQEAVRGTSFPVEEGDSAGDGKGGTGGASKLVAHWNWPVPLPANSAELAAKKAGGGNKGGCDGHGAKAKCDKPCPSNEAKCPGTKVCVGWDGRKLGKLWCETKGVCRSGGAWGVSGGMIMY